MPTNTRDPRTLITPDAFTVSEELLGTPLAKPSQRLVAILIDLFVISTLTIVTSDARLIVWGVVGLFLIQMAFRTPGKMRRATAFLFRAATGCLGLLVLSGVGIGYLVIQVSDEDSGVRQQVMAELADAGVVDGVGLDEDDVERLRDFGPGAATVSPNVGEEEAMSQLITAGIATLVSELQVGDQLDDTEDPETASRLLYGALDAGDGVGVDPAALRDIVRGLVTEDAEYTDDPEAFADGVFEEWARERGVSMSEVEDPADGGGAATTPADDDEEGRSAVASMTVPQLLREWAARVEAGDTLAGDARATAVRSRLAGAVAADTLRVLERSADRLENRLESREEELAEAEEQLAAGEAGLTGLLRDIWEQLGSAFGLWSIYFTVCLALFRGRTVGKLVTRTRVVRLDGDPITWWAAFERCGGYFAGIATGLLGFAQVYWDPNRQCVHDKISGTAVIQVGQPRDVEGWRRAAGVDAGPDATPPHTSSAPFPTP